TATVSPATPTASRLSAHTVADRLVEPGERSRSEEASSWRRGHGTTSANRWRDGYDTKVAASTPVRRRDEQPGRSPTARGVAKAGGPADRPHRRRTPEDGRAPQARTTDE